MNEKLLQLARQVLPGELEISILQGDGSDRQLYRIVSKETQKSAIGVWHLDMQENSDFLFYTEKMIQLGLPVPKVLAQLNPPEGYLLEDLGAFTLAQKIEDWNQEGNQTLVLKAYERVLDYLPTIQEQLAQKSYSHLSARSLGQKEVTEDIHYFYVNFLERFGFESNFTSTLVYELQQKLIEPAMSMEANFFVYRDFQARNFMWHQGGPYFIDYQSAMLGNRYYDLASMLYASKAGLNAEQRQHLIGYAHKLLERNLSLDEFTHRVYLFVLLRRLRSLGSYGYLALSKGKWHFFPAIGPSLSELVQLLFSHPSYQELSEIPNLLLRVRNSWPSVENHIKRQIPVRSA